MVGFNRVMTLGRDRASNEWLFWKNIATFLFMSIILSRIFRVKGQGGTSSAAMAGIKPHYLGPLLVVLPIFHHSHRQTHHLRPSSVSITPVPGRTGICCSIEFEELSCNTLSTSVRWQRLCYKARYSVALWPGRSRKERVMVCTCRKLCSVFRPFIVIHWLVINSL